MGWSVADPWLLAALFFGTAVLYSSVGNAGASGYLAAMTLAGFSPEMMKSTALLLNIIVACITVVRFYRAGYFSWPLFWPFTVASVPCAFLGGDADTARPALPRARRDCLGVRRLSALLVR